MVFSSYIFLFYFLPVTLLVYYNLPARGRNLFLTLMSYVFYGWMQPWWGMLMLVCSLVNYGCGWVIARPAASPRVRKTALVAACAGSLGLLGFFKYFSFSVESLNVLLAAFGRGTLPVIQIALPIGISFFTFQALSYTVDVYRGDARPARSLIDFLCFVSLYPQLIAGPILRYHTVAAQLEQREHTTERFAAGVAIFILGLAKKIILANPAGGVADAVFAADSPLALDAWVGVVAYAFQIYFDFCGYSDMAVGLGRMLGFEFMKNFNAPYLADSITDFWRRWHISLSTFLRDYLYIPLGGNRKGAWRTYVNLFLVMLLGGLWHGAQWTFVVWGAYHGLLLIGERWLGKKAPYSVLPRPIRTAFTFVLVLFAWVVFRADSLHAAGCYLTAMFGGGAGNSPLLAAEIYSARNLFFLGLCAVFVVQPVQALDWVARPLSAGRALLLLLVLMASLALMFTRSSNPFLYFQF